MKRTIVCCVLLIAVCFTLVACDINNINSSEAVILKASSYAGQSKAYDGTLTGSVQEFCADISLPTMNLAGENENTAISPISIYFALAMASECASGDTRAEILDVLGIDHATLLANIKNLCILMNEYYVYDKDEEGTQGKNGEITTANAVWLDDSVQYNKDCLDTLANNFNASSYHADFANDNRHANDLMRAYAKEQTHGLIDKDFNLDSTTLFTLINTLYLKEVWNLFGDDKTMTKDTVQFTQSDGNVVEKKMLYDGYITRKKHNGENFSSYYVSTYHGYRIYFMLPNIGIGANEIMTKENILETLNASYYQVGNSDLDNKIMYETNCIFPEFSAKYDNNISPVLMAMGMQKAFSSNADFSNLLNGNSSIATVQHVTDLTVDKKGIEGAAVTAIVAPTSIAPDEYTVIRETFEVNRAFGYIITNSENIPIFSGAIHSI